MGNLFSRIKDSIEADLHDALDQKEQKNPVAALNQYLRQSEQETEKVRKLVERQYRLKEEFTKEYVQAQEMADKRKRQSEIAQKAGEEEMHQFALNEYQEYAVRAERMKDLRDEASGQLENLEQKYQEMKNRLKDMRLKRMEIMGKENMIHANHRINKIMDDAVEKPYSRFGEIDQYMKELEQKVNGAYYRNTFDSKIAQLEREMKEQEKTTSN